MDDPQPTNQPQKKTNAQKPRSVRPVVHSTKPRSKKTRLDAENTPDETAQDSDKADEGAHGHSGDKSKSTGKWPLDFLISSAVLIVVALLLETAFGWSEAGKTRLKASDAAAVKTLQGLQPFAIRDNFYDRLLQEHGFALYQWDAPFNAEIARERLQSDLEARYPRAAAVQPLGDIWPVVSNVDTGQSDAHDAAMRQGLAQINRFAFGFGTIPGQNILAIALGLPDAYLNLVRTLVPHGSLIVQASIVILLFAMIRLAWLKFDKQRDGWELLLFLALLPLAISLIEWVLQGVGLAAAQKLGDYLAAPALSVTASLGASPFLVWATSKITEHHLFELVHHSVRRMLFKEE